MTIGDTVENPKSKRKQFRCDDETGSRIDRAAAECQMETPDWIRAVIDSALDLHEANVAQMHEDANYDDDVPTGDPTPDDPDYAEQVRAAAATVPADLLQTADVQYQDDEVLAPEPPERPNPRDCVHPLHKRRGPNCGVCGLRVGQMRMAGATGRYVGPSR